MSNLAHVLAPHRFRNASTATFTREDPSTSPNGPDRQKSLSRLVGGGGGNRITKSSIGPATAPVHGNQRISVGAPAAMSTSPTTPMRAPSSAFGGNNNVADEGSAIAKIGKPDFSGYVKKKGERYNTWKTRYFVLKGAHLYYMKSPQEDKVKGHIDLAGYKVLSDPNAGSGFGFQLVHDREKTHFFASNDHRVIKDWMKNLMKATISRDYSGESSWLRSTCVSSYSPLWLARQSSLQPRLYPLVTSQRFLFEKRRCWRPDLHRRANERLLNVRLEGTIRTSLRQGTLAFW